MSKNLAQQQTEWDLHENPETFIPLEFTEEIKPETFGLEISKATEMVSGLSTTLAEREVLKNAYIDVIGLEITAETLPTFKELRLKIVKNRTQGIEKWHKTNKAFYLAGGRFVDAVKNKEVLINEEMESKLIEAEKYFENIEKQKAKELNDLRIEKIRPYLENAENMTFAEFSDEDFDDLVFAKKTRFEANIESEKQEAIRIENESLAEIERQKAIEEENAKLKALAIEKEKVITKRNEALRPYIRYIRDYNKVLNLEDADFEKELSNLNKEAIETVKFEAEEERKRQQAILNAQNEKDARLKAEKELQAKKDAEIKAENERLAKIESDKKSALLAAKAPVKKQLSVWVESFELPIINIENETSKEIKSKFEAFKLWSINQINNL